MCDCNPSRVIVITAYVTDITLSTLRHANTSTAPVQINKSHKDECLAPVIPLITYNDPLCHSPDVSHVQTQKHKIEQCLTYGSELFLFVVSGLSHLLTYLLMSRTE